MNDSDSDRAGPMLNPPHLGELIRESMEETGWSVTETASRLGWRAWNSVALTEWPGRSVRVHGSGAGEPWLGNRPGALDADAGELRPCASTRNRTMAGYEKKVV